ncbi:hypothetical protein [uncultured Desulfobacter sp.]|uniref:hypothetical protein n=1 Tax=uncultured Desulfobacter sp. TaxID=240139 RepID=UPI003749B8D5
MMLVACALKPPGTFIKSFDESGIWKTIEVRENLDRDELWRLMVDTLTQKYDLEVVQKDSGYIRTSWKHTYVRNGAVIQNYRSRIVVKTVGEDWGKVQIKCESNWLDNRQGWLLGYDTRLLADAFSDIQGKIGRVVR